MAKDTGNRTKAQTSRVAISIVSQLSKLQGILNKHGMEDGSQQIKEIGSMMRYLLINFSESKCISIKISSETDIDSLISLAEMDTNTVYQGDLLDGRSFKFRVSMDETGKQSRILSLLSFRDWLDNGMENIAFKAFKGRKWVAERPLLRDSDVMHFIEE